MKRNIPALLALAALLLSLALSGCGENVSRSIPETEAPATEAPETAVPAVTETAGTTEAPESTVPETALPETETVPETVIPETLPPEEPAEAPRCLTAYAGQCQQADWSEHVGEYGGSVSWLIYDNVMLDEADAERYPELNAALEQLMDTLHTQDDEDYLTVAANAADFDEQAYEEGGFYMMRNLAVVRADSRVFSLLSCRMYYDGEDWTNQIQGYNFDTRTGKLLELSEVLKDGYDPSADLSLCFIGGIDGYDAEQGAANIASTLEQGNFAWSLGYSGISFIFPEGAVMPEEEYRWTATLYFDDEAAPVRKTYTEVPESYMAMFLNEGAQEYILPGCDSAGFLRTYCFYDDYGYPEKVQLETEKGVVLIDSDPDELQPVFIHNAGGNFCYLELHGWSDDADSHICDLDACRVLERNCLELRENLGRIGDFRYNRVITSPDYMPLIERDDTLGTSSVCYHASFGEDGSLTRQDRLGLYTYPAELSLKHALALFEYDAESGNAGAEMTLPAGTVLKKYALAEDGTALFTAEDGSLLGCHIDIYNWYEGCERWGCYIGDESVDDIFDGILYAD